MIDRESVLAVIPAFNEEETIAGVVTALRAAGIERVRVVDNASSDRTAAVARAAGAEVVSEPRRGYGQACFTGYQNLPAEVEWVLFCDADGSDDVDALPRLFEAAEGSDFVLGDRRATHEGRAAMTPVQNFGNWLATFLLRMLYGQRYRDLGPMRLIRRSALEAMAMRDRGFGWTVEMQARACEMRLRIAEVPVGYFARRGGESKISGTVSGSVRAGTIILLTLADFFVRRLQPAVAAFAVLGLLAGAWAMAPYGDFGEMWAVLHFLEGALLMTTAFAASWLLRDIRAALFFVVAIAARAILLPMTPGTDVWRYIWEGWSQNHGFNPYLVAPASELLAPLRMEGWSRINHPSISAVYPPLAELVFRGISAISPTLAAYKAIIVGADLAVCALLWRRFGRGALIYAWNPLVVYVFAGGAHYDSLFILPMVAAWLLWERSDSRRSVLISALLLGIAVGMKYMAAPLVLFVLWRAYCRHGWRTAAAAAMLAAAPFLLTLAVFWMPHGIHSLAPAAFTEYVRSAEFLPRLVAELWPASQWMNKVFLWPVAIGLVLLVLLRRSFTLFAEDGFLLLYAFSPAIHPWYFTWAIPFACATGNLGLRMAGITGFVYFILEFRQSMLNSEWRQTWAEWAILWLPIMAGFAWTRWQALAARKRDRRCLPAPGAA